MQPARAMRVALESKPTLIHVQLSVGARRDQCVHAERGAGRGGGLPPLQSGASWSGRLRPTLEPRVISLGLAQIETLEGDDALGGGSRRGCRGRVSGQAHECAAALRQKPFEVAAVLALGMVLVPVERMCAGIGLDRIPVSWARTQPAGGWVFAVLIELASARSERGLAHTRVGLPGDFG